MKTKTEAAKILLEKGWTFEDIERVLGREQIVINPAPYTLPVQPTLPFPPRPWWQSPNITVTSGGNYSASSNGIKYQSPNDEECDRWDKEIERDVAAGKFDKLAQEARDAHNRGDVTPL